MIFVDSDAYLAVYLEKDAHHKKAVKILKYLQDVREEVITSWDVIDEVTTKLSYYFTKSLALKFLNTIITSRTHIEYVSQEKTSAIQRLFTQQKSKRISLSDCTNMVIARSLGISTFLSFDRHYLKNGFKLLE